jgi:hypothetical protein
MTTGSNDALQMPRRGSSRSKYSFRGLANSKTSSATRSSDSVRSAEEGLLLPLERGQGPGPGRHVLLRRIIVGWGTHDSSPVA